MMTDNPMQTRSIELRTEASNKIVELHQQKVEQIMKGTPKIHQKLQQQVNGTWVNTAKHERKPSWLELLFDFCVVSAVSQSVQSFQEDIKNDPNTAPFIYVLKLYPLLTVWVMYDLYNNRFGDPESLFDNLFSAVLFSLLSMTVVTDDTYYLHAQDDQSSFKKHSLQGIAIGLSACYFAIALAYLRVAYYLPEARPVALSLATSLSWVSTVYLVTGLSGFSWGIQMWFLYSLGLISCILILPLTRSIGVWMPWERFKMKYTFIPINVHLTIERSGLVVIIAIGEIITKLYGYNLSADSYGYALLAIILGFLYKFMYFDVFNAIGEGVDKIAHQVSMYRGMAYIQCIPVVVSSIVLSHVYMVPLEASSSHRRTAADEGQHYDDDSSSYERIIYHQLVFTFAVVITMNIMYLLGQLHVQSSLKIRIQKVKQSYRTAFIAIASLLLLVIAGSIKFNYHNQLIAITEVILAICLLFECLCQWYFVDLELIGPYLHRIRDDALSSNEDSKAASHDNASTSDSMQNGEESSSSSSIADINLLMKLNIIEPEEAVRLSMMNRRPEHSIV